MSLFKKEPDDTRHALERAERYLAAQPRSRAQVYRYLQRHYSIDVVEAAVRRLEELALLDDDVFARSWAESRRRHRPRSAALIARELAQRGVASDVIEDAMGDIDDEASARAAAQAFIRRRQGSTEELYRKGWQHLRRRGFGPAAARKALEGVLERYATTTGDTPVEGASLTEGGSSTSTSVDPSPECSSGV